jgi:hypothetical protein
MTNEQQPSAPTTPTIDSETQDVVSRLLVLRDTFRPAHGLGPQTVGSEAYRTLVTGNTLAAIYDACELINRLSHRLSAAQANERDAARASDEHTAKVLRAMERDYRQQLDTAREALREAQRDAAIARDLIDLCGYVEDGSHTTVSIFQDDASSQWALYVGKRPYYGNSLREAIDEALARPSPASASAATCATWGAINAALNSTGQLAPLASVAAQTSEDEADAHLSKALELLREALPCVFAVHMEEVGTRLCKPGTLTARIEEYLKSVEGK